MSSTNPATAPLKCVCLGLAPSFGFGDRTGLATPGHVAAMQQAGAGIEPIFPQQSIREMARTSRTPTEVMSDAITAMEASGWKGVTGADADHLKTTADVDVTSRAGFTFFTIDPSGHVDPKTDHYDELTLRERYKDVAGETPWVAQYRGRSIRLPGGTQIMLTELSLLRAAVKYGRAINAAVELAHYIDRVSTAANQPYEIELSVDETEQPTTLAEHFVIADQCLSRGVKLVSLAPRFLGDFEKGVDYKGPMEELEQSLADHAAVASMLSPYKLSLHSGSDKLSMYPALARATRGRFHVKTAGTSYLEALRVVARHDEALFREIIDFCRSRYETDRATYHVSATLAGTPAAKDVKDVHQLEQIYLECWPDVPAGHGFTKPGRQILHCTFGSVLTHAKLGQAVKQLLAEHPDTYRDVLCDHFARHLEALRAGM